MLLGLGSNFELWDRPTWEARSIDDVNKLDASILEQISF
jgi:DNA-binding transcriptional regulator/RsmH inhibitor MraZ